MHSKSLTLHVKNKSEDSEETIYVSSQQIFL